MVDRVLACDAAGLRSIPATYMRSFSSRISGGRKELEPVMMELQDLASPITKKQVLALSSMVK